MGDDDFVPIMVGSEAAIRIRNAVAKLGGCEYVLLAGLSKAQRSYFDTFGHAEFVEIASLAEAPAILESLGLTKPNELRCRFSEVLLGLHLAQRSDSRLVFDNDAPDLPSSEARGNCLVVVEEDLDHVASAVAINYAHSIDADIAIVLAVSRRVALTTLDDLEQWRNGDLESLHEIAERVTQRIGFVDFTQYDFVTFFTSGLPYSLILEGPEPRKLGRG
jgi:hypothetical protein